MRIYEKRGVWYLQEDGKDLQTFPSEAKALAAAGKKQTLDISEADVNHDGMITREEVLAWLDENEDEDYELKG